MEAYKYITEKYNLKPYCFSDIPEGWKALVDTLFGELSKTEDWDPKKVAQIKEKFGELRVYLDDSSEECEKLIASATKLSRKICQYCGLEASTESKGGWLTTLCVKCKEK